jgi:hypothetical protein
MITSVSRYADVRATLTVLQAAVKADKQQYRIQHIIKAYRESAARLEAAEAELSALKSSVTA